eukprot:15362702-Ditylum_brightwellii.AAC.1
MSELADDSNKNDVCVIGSNNSDSGDNDKTNALCDDILQNKIDQSTFVEILPPKKERPVPERVEVYVTEVQPKFCGRLLKELNALAPLRRKNDNDKDDDEEDVINLEHLRR